MSPLLDRMVNRSACGAALGFRSGRASSVLGRFAGAKIVAAGKCQVKGTAMVLAASFETWSPTAVPPVFGSRELLCVLVAVGSRSEAKMCLHVLVLVIQPEEIVGSSGRWHDSLTRRWVGGIALGLQR